MSEKTEQPTDKKLDDARKEGQVAVSKDLTKLASLFVLGEIAFATEAAVRDRLNGIIELILQRIGQDFTASIGEVTIAVGSLLMISFVLLGIVGIVIGIATHWGQFGILISTKILTPKFDRLNPAQGAKNLFSKKKLMELLTNVAKASILGLIIYLEVKSQLPNIIALSNGSPNDSYNGFITILHSALKISILASLVFGAVDFAIQKKMHIKSQMMSMDDIKREYKESEGDPMVKGQRRQIARELAESGPVSKTNDADAVVVNPTHFAIALRYDLKRRPIPMMLAKGKDETAQAMIERAHELKIPVIRHVWLARMLYATGKPDAIIPRPSFEAVAHVYAVISEMKGAASEGVVELEKYGEGFESGE
jgi:type III secretion protein U